MFSVYADAFITHYNLKKHDSDCACLLLEITFEGDDKIALRFSSRQHLDETLEKLHALKAKVGS